VTIVDTHTSRAVRVWPAADCRTRALQYEPEQPSRWHSQLAAYQRMPVDDLLRSEWVELTLPLDVIIGQPGVRASCSRCREDILNGREMIVGGKPCCRSCAGESYWRPGSETRRATPSAPVAGPGPHELPLRQR
jgi:formylmethanofuran dehydrogenase subunit E